MARSKRHKGDGEDNTSLPAETTNTPETATRATPEWRAMLVAVLLPVALVYPFLGKAFHVDDPLFVWTAQQIAHNPLDFYGFMTNWETTRTYMYEVMQNPPMLSYFLAPIGATWGWSERVMHMAMMLPTALAGLGMYLLASRWCARPLLATIIAVSTPAFLVSATQVMSDVPMVACWLWAMYLWQLGLEKNVVPFLVGGAILIGVGALTKYYALSLVPLLFVYTLLSGKENRRHLPLLIIPLAILFAFEFYTYRLYHLGLLLDAASFASEHRAEQGVSPFIKTATTLVFMGGCLATPLLVAPCLWSWRGLLLLAGGVLGVFALIVFVPSLRVLEAVPFLSIHDVAKDIYAERFKDPSTWQLFQWALWFVAGLNVFYMAAYKLYRERDRDTLILMLWIGGTFTFTAYLNHHVNARVILPMAAAVAILAVRIISESQPTRPLLAGTPWAAVLATGGFFLSLILCNADYQLANSARLAADEIMEDVEFGEVYFSGHSGFQYYMEERGAQAIDKMQSTTLPGDTYVLPSNNWFPVLLDKPFVHDDRVETFPVNPYVSTSQYEQYAGFYSDYSGRLPFTFGSIPEEEYLILKLERLRR